MFILSQNQAPDTVLSSFVTVAFILSTRPGAGKPPSSWSTWVPPMSTEPCLPSCMAVNYLEGAEVLPALCMHVCKVASVVSYSVTPRTVAHQAPLSMGFSRKQYWGGVPFPSPYQHRG